jgi:hypothetical protein
MENINIKKGGLRQTVSLQAFKQMYKQNGWTIDETEIQPDTIQETVKILEPKGEHEVINYLAMKKRVPKVFDDGLFKSDKQV